MCSFLLASSLFSSHILQEACPRRLQRARWTQERKRGGRERPLHTPHQGWGSRGKGTGAAVRGRRGRADTDKRSNSQGSAAASSPRREGFHCGSWWDGEKESEGCCPVLFDHSEVAPLHSAKNTHSFHAQTLFPLLLPGTFLSVTAPPAAPSVALDIVARLVGHALFAAGSRLSPCPACERPTLPPAQERLCDGEERAVVSAAAVRHGLRGRAGQPKPMPADREFFHTQASDLRAATMEHVPRTSCSTKPGAAFSGAKGTGKGMVRYKPTTHGFLMSSPTAYTVSCLLG